MLLGCDPGLGTGEGISRHGGGLQRSRGCSWVESGVFVKVISTAHPRQIQGEAGREEEAGLGSGRWSGQVRPLGLESGDSVQLGRMERVR